MSENVICPYRVSAGLRRYRDTGRVSVIVGAFASEVPTTEAKGKGKIISGRSFSGEGYGRGRGGEAQAQAMAKAAPSMVPTTAVVAAEPSRDRTQGARLALQLLMLTTMETGLDDYEV